jgi:hypothetical protein
MMSVSAAVSRFVRLMLAVLALLAMPGLAAAQSADPPADAPAAAQSADPPAAQPESKGFWESTELGGLIDAYYDYYSTKPEGDAPYRLFDTRHNQFSLNMAELWLAKTPTADSRAGFRLRATAGTAATLINAYEPGGQDFLKNIEESYFSYLAPLGKGLTIDVGKFVTPLGAEVIEAKDNWNYSRSLLFSLAIPFYHAGVRVSYAPTDKVSVMGLVTNGWNNVQENNGAKTFGGQVSVKPTGALSIVQNYMTGPEQPDNNNDWRQISDTTVSFTATKAISLMANYDYGHDTVAGVGGHWQGIAGYAKLQANKTIAVIPRFEWYDDDAGITTGTPQTLKEATLTLEAKALDNLLWRIEYRGDFSDQDVFKNGNGAFKDSQHSIGFGMLYSFSFKGK